MVLHLTMNIDIYGLQLNHKSPCFKHVNLLTTLEVFYQNNSAASFSFQMAALVTDMHCNFYLVKNHKITFTSATTKAREKNCAQIWNRQNFSQIYLQI